MGRRDDFQAFYQPLKDHTICFRAAPGVACFPLLASFPSPWSSRAAFTVLEFALTPGAWREENSSGFHRVTSEGEGLASEFCPWPSSHLPLPSLLAAPAVSEGCRQHRRTPQPSPVTHFSVQALCQLESWGSAAALARCKPENGSHPTPPPPWSPLARGRHRDTQVPGAMTLLGHPHPRPGPPVRPAFGQDSVAASDERSKLQFQEGRVPSPG